MTACNFAAPWQVRALLPLLCTVRLRFSQYWPRGFACDCFGFQARHVALPRIVRPWPPLLTSVSLAVVAKCFPVVLKASALLRCTHARQATQLAYQSACQLVLPLSSSCSLAAVWRAGVNVISHVMVRFCSSLLRLWSRCACAPAVCLFRRPPSLSLCAGACVVRWLFQASWLLVLVCAL